MTARLRVGILGLELNWQQRYRRVLLASRERFAIAAVCDHVQQQAIQEAKRLKCAAAEGPSDLLTNHEVDALLFLDSQWYRLWPLELACRVGKPVFCVPGLDTDAACAEQLCARIEESRLPVMFELRPRYAPAAIRLRQLLHSRLGAVRLITCQTSDVNNAGSRILQLIDWCLYLMKESPTGTRAIQSQPQEGPSLSSLLLEFPGGRAAQVNCFHGIENSNAGRLADRQEVVAEHGTATLTLPNSIRWTHGSRECHERWRNQRPAEWRMLRRFYQLVRGQARAVPGLCEARTTFRVWQAAMQNQAHCSRP